jgi:Zn finger protein HypA/HybF involved in hydrogenase expression
VSSRQTIAIASIVVLLGAAGLLVYRNYTKAQPRIEPMPVRCAACGYLFIPRSFDEMKACPKCSSPDLVTVLWFRCRQCGTTFIGYEADPKTHLFRYPGGEWTASEAFIPVAVCPNCESKSASSTMDTAAIQAAIDAMQ